MDGQNCGGPTRTKVAQVALERLEIRVGALRGQLPKTQSLLDTITERRVATLVHRRS
jgi:hypothetical protein